MVSPYACMVREMKAFSAETSLNLLCGSTQDTVEELSRNELAKELYPYVKLPESLVGDGTALSSSAPARKVPHSVRTIRYNWAVKTETTSVVETSRYTSFHYSNYTKRTQNVLLHVGL